MALIHLAAGNGDLAEVMRLVEEETVNLMGFCGPSELVRSPLHTASMNGHVDVVAYLVDHGVNIDQGVEATPQDGNPERCLNGSTALNLACTQGHARVVEL